MIIIKIVGGLASQLHKYSIGRALSIKYNTELKFDLSWYHNTPKNDTTRKYMLNMYNIVGSEASPSEINNFKPNKFSIKCVNILNKIGLNIKFNHYINKSYLSIEEFNLLPNDIYIEGEWAGDKYFSNIKNILQEELKLDSLINLNIEKYSDLITSSKSVSIHFRRGDYITNSNAKKLHSSCGERYYFEALSLLKNKIGLFHLFIFSDDIKWVKKNIDFTDIKVTYIENIKDYEEFLLMSMCSHNIIANSFFSWMPSWLNSNENKLIISPSYWVEDLNLNQYIVNNIDNNNLIFLDNK